MDGIFFLTTKISWLQSLRYDTKYKDTQPAQMLPIKQAMEKEKLNSSYTAQSKLVLGLCVCPSVFFCAASHLSETRRSSFSRPLNLSYIASLSLSVSYANIQTHTHLRCD